jgi:hypothetical protein
VQLKKKDYFIKSLDFEPSHPTPSAGLAHAAYDTLLPGFEIEESGYVIDHGSLSPEKLLVLWKQLYPNLNLMDKVRLKTLPALQDESSPFFILNDFYGFDPQFNKLASLLKSLEPQYQIWLSDKSFGQSELIPLLDFSIEEVNQIMMICISKMDSRQLATQRIELIQELKGLGHTFDSLLHLELANLKKLRFPLAHQRDEKFAAVVKNWPSKIRAKTQRRGDTVGFEVNFFIASPIELEKLSEQLKKVAHEWNSNQINH